MKNQQGFSILEVMMASAVMVIVALGVMQSIYVSALNTSTVDVKNSLNALNGSIAQIAANQASCTMAITKTTQTYGSNVRFDLPDGTVVAAGSNVAHYPLVTSSFSYVNSTLVATGYDQTKIYFGSLALGAKTNRKVLGPQIFSPRTIASVYLTVSPSGTIVSCGSTLPTLPTAPAPSPTPVPTPPPAVYDPGFDQACTSGGGTYDGVTCTYNQPSGGCGH